MRSDCITDEPMGGQKSRETEGECIGSQTDKTGQRDFLFALQTPSLMFGGKEVSGGFYTAY